MSFNDSIYFIEDVAREYSKRRKGVSEQEAKELIKFSISYIRKLIKQDDAYAVEIPSIGILHKKLKTAEKDLENNKRTEIQYANILLNTLIEDKSTKPLIKKDIIENYSEFTKEELQNWQNNE